MTPRSAPPGRVYAQVYEVVRRIPEGKVLTYGLVSALLGGRLTAQGVGWALRALPDPPEAHTGSVRPNKPQPKRMYHAANVPWHRVVNSAGGISTHKNPDISPGEQRMLLEHEGVVFDEDSTLDLALYLWTEGLS